MASRLATILVIVIVGATLIAGFIVGAQRDDANGPIDLIIVNGRVYGGGAAMQEAVAVRGNQILRVGSNRDVKRLRRPQTVVVDAHGATVLPGLNDAHVRLMAGALALEQLDLSSATTTDELKALVGQYADEMPSRPWVLGRNGDPALFGTANLAARKLLDQMVPDRPVLLTSDDGKISLANSEALKRAGIGGRVPSARSSTIVRDRKTGESTGVLKAQAIDLMTHVLPSPSHADRILALRAAIEEAHRFGVTSVQSVTHGDEEMDLLKEIRAQGDLTLRVYGSLAVSADLDEAAVAMADALREAYPDDPTLKFGGMEMVCRCDPAKLEHAVTLLDQHDWPITVQASDERDVRAALDAFEHAQAVNPAPSRGRRYRLETTTAVGQDDLSRLARYGVLVRPSEADTSPEASVSWSALNEAGVRLLSGSGWPSGSFDPRVVLADASEASALPLRSLVDAYTGQAAFASYDEQRKGTLAPGMLADIVILSNDIFQSPSQSLKDTAVTVTIFDGRVVYKRPAQATSN